MFFSAVATVTGNVAADDLVNSAMSSAGVIWRMTLYPLTPRRKQKSGKITKNWMKLPPSTTSTYLPIDPTTTPADICAASCAANATMPTGSAQMSPLMSPKKTSCNPASALCSVRTFSLFFPSTAIAMPMPAEMRTIARTFPPRNGFTRLFGIALRMWPYTVSGTREICAIASASSATARTTPGSIVPGSTSTKSPSPTSAATNDVSTV